MNDCGILLRYLGILLLRVVGRVINICEYV